MSEAWFHLADLPAVGETAALAAREARHAAGARRLGAGDEIHLFDGAGTVARGEIANASRGSIEVRVLAREEQAPPRPEVHLASALPKGDRQAILLSMVTQLGIASFTPLRCERSGVRAGPGFAARADRICVEACKQSRRAHLPSIEPPATPGECAAAAAARQVALFAAQPGGRPAGTAIKGLPQDAAAMLIIGPEGGFTDAEVGELIDEHAVLIDLGAGILRIETAAVAVVALRVLAAADVK